MMGRLNHANVNAVESGALYRQWLIFWRLRSDVRSTSKRSGGAKIGLATMLPGTFLRI
jgi:hypothetical protein